MVMLLLKQPATPKLPITNLPQAVEVDREQASVDDIVTAIQSSTKLAPSRLKLFLASSKTVLVPNSPLKVYDMHDGTRVLVKDIGPQINRRTLLLTAYTGPVFIHILCYYFQTLVYGTSFQHTASQVLAFTLITLHFAKRIFETLFVHVFYRITASFYSVYMYLFHYWLLSGVFMAYYIYYPSCATSESSQASIDSSSSGASSPSVAIARGVCSSSISLLSSSIDTEETSLYFLSALWIFAELSNFETHLILANLHIRFPRPSYASSSFAPSHSRLLAAASPSASSSPTSSRPSSPRPSSPFRLNNAAASTLISRRIPKGYGFDWVSCPNYFFELIAWTAITLITRSFASLLFLVATGMQMWRRAVRKHELYKKEFGVHYPKYRKVLIPYIK
ncbi:3-oxo-5-alpha-steroid 4-dehydrogenase-domain-containing protein [Limtongia smithiae]|uniref:3-oxo-5-alpha-steroid 4-dehydrogenase-domain-containing protein n=1 Tax=Limtongia smithiae TaxID=1125753 RepID=UPI0034CDE458